MPQEFDSQWEYYCPDPEVEELLEESSNRTLKNKHAQKTKLDYEDIGSFSVCRKANTESRCNKEEMQMTAYLYSKGVKIKEIASIQGTTYDTIDSRLRTSNVVRNRKSMGEMRVGVCPTCNKEFPKDRECTIYCSKRCYGSFRVKQLMEAGKPLWVYDRSVRCRKQSVEHRKKKLLSYLWKRDYTVWEIECRLRITTAKLNQWRKELGLPSRRKSHATTGQ